MIVHLREGLLPRTPFGALLLASFALGCVPPAPIAAEVAPPIAPQGPPRTSGHDAPGPSALSPQPGRLDTDRAKREATRILGQVAAARQLEVTGPIRVEVANKADIRAYAKANMYEHITTDELALQGRISASLGIIAKDADLEQVLLDALEDGVLGFYDPKEKTLFIGDYVSTGLLSQVVGHEIAHGLQDMHFDLEARAAPTRHRSDQDEAERFLIEGGAQAAYLAWVSGEDGLAMIDDAVLEAMVNQSLELVGVLDPAAVLTRSLHLPYTAGTATVVRAVLEGGWPAIDKLYAAPPTTTEQMLHLDKLLALEPAREVEIDHSALERAFDKSVVWYDQMGEAQLLAVLADVEPASIARRCAAGWGGDALVALEREGAPMTVVIALAMDDRREAEELEPALRKYVDERIGSSGLVARRRDTLVLVAGVPDGRERPALIAELWSAISVGKPTTRRSRR